VRVVQQPQKLRGLRYLDFSHVCRARFNSLDIHDDRGGRGDEVNMEMD
jgi:hypothetical protein